MESTRKRYISGTESGHLHEYRIFSKSKKLMKRLIKKTNITEIRFHVIHTHASILISEGIDVVNISVRLGHENPKITLEFYLHLISNTSRDVANVFHRAIQKGFQSNSATEKC
ncbi:hypothetical protein DVB69_01870 [Sporosarcina sp. BI001-red]|uniref:tyrosine-type recombinase/integrase n=1 Tax=Sporosarcina sp. BI001-red TaxID=2282866 RepID=UPI000E24EF3E|nr:hypothetical protein DVB69_01870 [Sporosarcina sp. BI001-red]